MQLNDDEQKSAANVISSRLSHSQIDKLLDKYLPPQLLPRSGKSIIGTKLVKSLFLVQARGSELLYDKELRKHLVKGDPGIATLLSGSKKKEIALEDVAIKTWHPGKIAALKFAKTLGLPKIFAGEKALPTPETIVDIEPINQLSPLFDFQLDVVEQILELMNNLKNNEAMISLPTGAGKTRVAMEAIVRYQSKFEDGIIIWLATTSEVCEQACLSYLMLRKAYPLSTVHQLHRFWGTHNLNSGFERGLMVASVQKLRSTIEKEAIPYKLLRKLQAVYFDEGHHAIAPTYSATIDYLGQAGEGKQIPIIGLTATPGRGSSLTSEASKKLVKRFGRKLITPRGIEWDDPVKTLQERGILCKVNSVIVNTKRNYSLKPQMLKYWEEFKDFSPEFLRQLAQDTVRNSIIVDQVKKLAENKRGIIFTCSVEHAEYLAFLLQRIGRPTSAVSSDTRPATRMKLLALFKKKKLDFITNFGILTTGFDEPSVDVIVLARPVASLVLYEQMVGRGMRGKKFGGTEECLLIDFEDNIEGHGRPLAYTRFRSIWN